MIDRHQGILHHDEDVPRRLRWLAMRAQIGNDFLLMSNASFGLKNVALRDLQSCARQKRCVLVASEQRGSLHESTAHVSLR